MARDGIVCESDSMVNFTRLHTPSQTPMARDDSGSLSKGTPLD
jgi:hypothetical protein